MLPTVSAQKPVAIGASPPGWAATAPPLSAAMLRGMERWPAIIAMQNEDAGITPRIVGQAPRIAQGRTATHARQAGENLYLNINGFWSDATPSLACRPQP